MLASAELWPGNRLQSKWENRIITELDGQIICVTKESWAIALWERKTPDG